MVTTARFLFPTLALCALLGGCGREQPSNALPSGDRVPSGQRASLAPQSAAPSSAQERAESARIATRKQSLDWDVSHMMRGLKRLDSKVKTTAYVHGIDVDTRRGYYAFDCSGMVEWVLRDSAPAAYQSLRQRLSYRPLARDFVERVAGIAPGGERGHWKRVARLAEAEPGDVIAWLKPKIVKSQNTGHVAIVVQRPQPLGPSDTAYLVRVADSSRLIHENDSRRGRGGFGYGTILIETDSKTGAPTGFSFSGSRAQRIFGTKIVVGRPLR